MKKKNFSYFFIALFLLSNSFVHADLSAPKDQFDDVLLIVHYNHPHFESISLLQNLYSCFPNIVFYGEGYEHNVIRTPLKYGVRPSPNVISVGTQHGFFFSRIVEDALTRFPGFQGYLFIQDDVWMNFWHFSRLNKEKIWFGIPSHSPSSLETNWNTEEAKRQFLASSHDNDWVWWQQACGLQALELAISQLTPQDREKLKETLGSQESIGILSNLFYLPQKVKEDAIRISQIFKNVFCEIAIPMMLICLDPLENWEFLKGASGHTLTGGTMYREDVDWLHPMKFSLLQTQNAVESLSQGTNSGPLTN